MADGAWLFLGVVFVAVTAVVLGVGVLVDRWQTHKQWRRIVDEVARADAGPAPAPELGIERGGARPSARWLEAVAARMPGRRRIALLLEQAPAPWGVAGFVARALALGAVLGTAAFVMTGSLRLAAMGFAAGAALPYLRLRRRRAKRLARFAERIPEAVELLGRAIRAGHPFSMGLRMVADEGPEPIASEFRRVFDEQKYGLPLQESLRALAQRVDLVDVRLFVTAVLVQREVGGNLAEILDRIANTVRERFKIQRQVAVYTAQGRLTGLLLALMPAALGVLIFLVNREYMIVLVREPIGRVMLGMAVTLQIVGYLIIRRIVAIEI